MLRPDSLNTYIITQRHFWLCNCNLNDISD